VSQEDPHPTNENPKTIAGRAGRLSPHPERRRRGSPKAGRHQQSVAHFVEITGQSFRAEHTKKQLTARRSRGTTAA